jgi:hypothetical protein
MVSAISLRDQHFHRLADQFGFLIAKQGFDLPIDHRNHPVGVNDQHPARR